MYEYCIRIFMYYTKYDANAYTQILVHTAFFS